MGDITSFLEKYESDYCSVRETLDRNVVLGIITDPSVILEVDYAFRRERKVWKKIGMSTKNINDYVVQLKELAAEIPMRPGCLSVNSILDFVESNSSEQENQKYFVHLSNCSKCRDKVFKSAWFFLG